MADRTHLSSNQVGFVHNDDNSDYNENYNNDNNEGEMLWYESARLVHGRPQPLQGKMYDDEDFDDEDVGEDED